MARQEKAPAATEASRNDTSSPTSVQRKSITPRQRRALQALLSGPQTTLRLRDAIGCINVSDCLIRLRERGGFTIPRVNVKVTDRDGKTCTVGSYSLTASDVKKIRQLLPAEGGG